jgi:hypothetical protein
MSTLARQNSGVVWWHAGGSLPVRSGGHCSALNFLFLFVFKCLIP